MRFLAVISLLAQSLFAGVSVTIENDYFLGTDDSYTHGTEFEWTRSSFDGYGFRQVIYTPERIDVQINQPFDRPWCGLLTAFKDEWSFDGNESWTRYEIGMIGPSSLAGKTQAQAHRIIGVGTPKGWRNQMPDEPVVQVYHESLFDVVSVSDFDLSILFGGAIGTTFIHGISGVESRLGINLPARRGGIQPKVVAGCFHAYVFARLDCLLVAHNATLSDSFFENRLDNERDLEHVVPERSVGFSVGYDPIAVVMSANWRSEEFDGQSDPTEWCMISIEAGWRF